jgi:hypothetical protein
MTIIRAQVLVSPSDSVNRVFKSLRACLMLFVIILIFPCSLKVSYYSHIAQIQKKNLNESKLVYVEKSTHKKPLNN